MIASTYGDLRHDHLLAQARRIRHTVAPAEDATKLVKRLVTRSPMINGRLTSYLRGSNVRRNPCKSAFRDYAEIRSDSRRIKRCGLLITRLKVRVLPAEPISPKYELILPSCATLEVKPLA